MRPTTDTVATPPAPTQVPPTVRRPARPPEPQGRFERLVVPPDIGGPRVRVGVLWFLLAMAAVTGGRWWTGLLVAGVAAAAAYQLARAWSGAESSGAESSGAESSAAEPPDTELAESTEFDEDPSRSLPWVAPAAAAGAAAVPLAASWATGASGAVLVVLAAVIGTLGVAVDRRIAATLAISMLMPGIAAASIVWAIQIDLWAALFLVLAVSLYDAGNFALGAEASGRWEGPVGGVIGALAVTFTMATIKVPPLERPQWWIAGVVVAATCAAGQWLTSYFLPTPTAWAPAMRRLDAYLLSGPLLVLAMWLMGA